jgi:hypothetical protein
MNFFTTLSISSALEINNLWDWKLQWGKSSEDFKVLTA